LHKDNALDAREETQGWREIHFSRRAAKVEKNGLHRTAVIRRRVARAFENLVCRNEHVCEAEVACAKTNFPKPRGIRASLLRGRHQRVRDGMYRESDTVLHTDFAHEFGDVRFYSPLFDSQY